MTTPKTCVGRFREWLHKNEVFFDTLFGAIISIVGISLAIQANNLSFNANNLINRQNQINENQMRPSIDVNLNILDREVLHDYLSVEKENQYGQALDVNIDYFTYLEITYKTSYDTGNQAASVPLVDYYLPAEYNTDFESILAIIPDKGKDNRQKFEQLQQNTTILFQERGVGFITLQAVVQVKYENSVGELQEEYHLISIDPPGISQHLKPDIGLSRWMELLKRFSEPNGNEQLIFEETVQNPALVIDRWNRLKDRPLP